MGHSNNVKKMYRKKYSLKDIHTCALIIEDICNTHGCDEGYRALLECLEDLGEDR